MSGQESAATGPAAEQEQQAQSLPDGRPWAVVERRALSAGRVRLLFLVGPETRRWVTVDRELDTPDYHERIVAAIRSQSV